MVYRSPCTERERTGSQGLGNRRTDPRGPTAAERGVQLDKPPEMKPERVESLCVRSLRTQQRAESQCQVCDPFVGFFGLMDVASVSSRFSAWYQASTESLILAQDERWRRA